MLLLKRNFPSHIGLCCLLLLMSRWSFSQSTTVSGTVINIGDNINANGASAPLRYSDADIQSIIDGSNPNTYANVNWAKEILRKAPLQNH